MPFDPETLLTDLPEKSRRDVPRVINRLLGQTFLYQDVESDKDDYYFVYRHRPVFEGMIALAGFSLLHDDYHRIFQAVSDFSYCRAHYRLDETLMIVVLRKLYEERAERLSLANDPVVTVGEVREEYRTITGKERDLGIVQYETLLRRLRSMGLIDTLEETCSGGQSTARRNSVLRGNIPPGIPAVSSLQDAVAITARPADTPAVLGGEHVDSTEGYRLVRRSARSRGLGRGGNCWR